MSVKIRLQRHGRKKAPYYHVVVADSRAPRDGKFIELLGFYKPQTIPATIEINFESAVNWLGKGAQPTDTARAILSYKGALYRHHLNKGVNKGVLTQEQADAKFNKWMEEKASKVAAHVERQGSKLAEKSAAMMTHEAQVNQARAAKIAEKLKAAEEAASVSEVEAAATEESPAAETNATPSDTTETPAE